MADNKASLFRLAVEGAGSLCVRPDEGARNGIVGSMREPLDFFLSTPQKGGTVSSTLCLPLELFEDHEEQITKSRSRRGFDFIERKDTA